MAFILKKYIMDNNGAIIDDCYCRIIDIDYTHNPILNVRLAYYYNKDARVANKVPLQTKTYANKFDPQDGSRSEIYTWLKTQEEFKKAKDDLE